MYLRGKYGTRLVFYEVDNEGLPSRNISLQTVTNAYDIAVDRDEWMDELQNGDLNQYQVRYGQLADVQLGAGDLAHYEQIPKSEFDVAWSRARGALDRRWRNGGQAEYESRDESTQTWTPLTIPALADPSDT